MTMRKLLLSMIVGITILSGGIANASLYYYQETIPNQVNKWYSPGANQTFTGLFDVDSPTKYFSFSSPFVSYDSASDVFAYTEVSSGYNFKFTPSKVTPYYADFFLQDSDQNGVIERIQVTDWYNINTPDELQQSFSRGITPSAVPIPAAVWLLGSGVVGLIAMRRKAQK